MALMKKLYVYVDETGQDTLGTIFVVVTVVVQEAKDELGEKLIMRDDYVI